MPNDVTLVSVLTACGRTGELILGRKIHGFAVGSGFKLDVFMGSSLIAIELFREMQVQGVKADEATVASVVSACGHLGALDQERWVHAYCKRNEIQMNLSVSNAFIDMHAKCGDIVKALEIFHELVQKDVFSWTVMISGLAMNGKSDEALELFTLMEISSEVRPNEITYLGVLTACSHGGLIVKGFHHFGSMTKTYNLIPHIEHYGCMVYLLGRANLLIKAKMFIMAMRIEPDVVIWRSLLFFLGLMVM
ncbi:Pentatricopeptide repeat-containing protein [Thalictrum thalictroides]|uniref:Pentatricopeptide repeat-containing protein n=1 Tax=Thalictrum thalictroides TaxID=46969 RepID=A0A7J6WT15_THATH|nr:Pentatricopeptide repeat-containing protein [Thalictrum thalictroides]